MTIDALDRLLETVEAAHIRLFPERCLNRRHKGAGCRFCIEGCPSEAITLDDPIALDLDHCLNCGLCLHLCPTEVFVQTSPPEDKLVEVLASLPRGGVELACHRQEQPGLTRADVAAVVQTKRCLAALSLPLLLDLAARGDGAIWLNDELCEGCALGGVQDEIVKVVDTANRLLTIFGRQARLFTYRSAPASLLTAPRERPVVAGDQPRYSRRGFFTALSLSSRRTLATLIAEGLSSPGQEGSVPVEERLPQRLPLPRQRLQRSLARLGEPTVGEVEAEGLPFTAVEIAPSCSACGLCARFCPTGALAFVATEGHFVLRLTLPDCLDCGLCALICPSDSVSFPPRFEAAALVDRLPRVLLAGELTPCAGCGASCAATGDEPLCYVCRQKRDLLEDTRRLFASVTEV